MRFSFKGVAEVSKPDEFNSTDVKLAVEAGSSRDIRLVVTKVEAQTFKKPYFDYKAIARKVLAVAKPGAIGDDWAVYIDAVPGKNHEEEAPMVAAEGVKQIKAVACFLFPQFDPEKYRD